MGINPVLIPGKRKFTLDKSGQEKPVTAAD
jgi:hypothetical protein